MTNPTPHGQVPEALIDLIDAYAETRYRYGGIYSAKTEAARKAVIEALSGVQALSAAPAEVMKWPKDASEVREFMHTHCITEQYAVGIESPSDDDKYLLSAHDFLSAVNWWADFPHYQKASPTPPAEQQAAPKAAPVVWLSSKQLRGVTALHGQYLPFRCQPEGRFDTPVYLVEAAPEAAPQQEAQEPAAYVHVPHYTVEGKVRPVVSFEKYQQDYADGIYSTRIPLYTTPQPAPAPLSEMPYEKRKAIQEGEQIGASDAWFKARHEMLDTVDRRNVFRAGFDRGWNAALAAQGDTP